MALADALGNLVRFAPLPGQRQASLMAEPLIETVDTKALLADTAVDTNERRQTLDARGVTAVIPFKPERKLPILHAKVTYGWRYLIENAFCKLMQAQGLSPSGNARSLSSGRQSRTGGTRPPRATSPCSTSSPVRSP